MVASEDKSHLQIIQQRGQEKEAQWTIDEHISPRRPQWNGQPGQNLKINLIESFVTQVNISSSSSGEFKKMTVRVKIILNVNKERFVNSTKNILSPSEA